MPLLSVDVDRADYPEESYARATQLAAIERDFK